MSSNPYHNNNNNNIVITRNNYEEYLLMYVDDELTAEEKAAVDQFLLFNPDLQQELDILMQTKLPLELVPIDEKESLLSGSMKAKESEENLLLFIDNELNELEKRRVEEALERDAAYRLQYELLMKTKSDPAEKVVCPFKEELYHREKRKIPVFYWRAAAAVLLVVGMSTFMLTYQQRKAEEVAILPVGNHTQSADTSLSVNHFVVDQPAGEIADEKTSTPTERDINEVPVIAMEKREVKVTERRTNNTRVQPASVEEDMPTISMRQRPNDAPVLVPEIVDVPVSKPLTKEAVTSEPSYTYNNTDAPVNAVPAVAYEEEKTKTSLKGLLRKATRYVERRTNINVTNENEELVIGTVAISLK